MKGNLMIDSLMEHQSLDETLDFTAPVVDEPEHDEVTTPESLDGKTTIAAPRPLAVAWTDCSFALELVSNESI